MMMAGAMHPHFLFSVAPKRENGPCTVLVVAKSAKLRFRLTAKTAPAPLLRLSPPDPLRWVPAGTPIQKPLGSFPALRAWWGTGCGSVRLPLPADQFIQT